MTCKGVIGELLGRMSNWDAAQIVSKQREEAARQQGGLFVRENSSNGGKAIRTFWVAY
jgi:hypothetical protein